MRKILLPLMFISSTAFADTATDLRELVEQNLQHTEDEYVSAVMATMHPDSIAYLPTRQALNQLFPLYDLQYTLLEYHFVGEEGGYAYARVKQRTEKVNGPEFMDNDLEALQVFRQYKGEWKFWSQANLSVQALN